ncbi:MAG: DUF2232 domain-containing protein [Gemmatimonadaceae bacterium]
MTTEANAAPPREQGWWGPLAAGLLLLILPAMPPLGIMLPVAQTVVVVAPALAVCAIVGWRAGGRLPLALLWTLFALWVVWVPASSGTYAMLSSGWGVLLAASFGGVLLAGIGERFLPRALLALVIAFAVGALALLVTGTGFAEVGGVIAEEVSRRSEIAQAAWREFVNRPQWQDLVRENPDAGKLAEEVERQFALWPATARRIAPAMLAVESLAVLAFAWAIYHRFGRVRLGPPLASLRDLRFNDALVWGFIVGLLALVVPVPGVVRALGVNLLVFFGVLYALRGLGVILWYLSPGRWMMVLLTIVVVLFSQIVGLVAVGIGLGDTWLDWRRRPRPKSQRSE